MLKKEEDMSIHIGAEKGSIAEVVLLPGDPLRAKFIAESLFTDVVCYNQVRGMFGFTGTYKGQKVSVQGTGMGLPSHMIYVNELIHDFDAKQLIRIGTCGGILDSIKVRDIIVAMSASTDSCVIPRYFGEKTYAPTADFELLRRVVDAAEEKNMKIRVGNVLSSDLFYHFPEEGKPYDLWKTFGVMAVEMETAGLYLLASRYNVQALSILTVSDHITTGEHMPAIERQENTLDMTRLALAAI
ncbi:MAG: purine-nucleoside phosphorylase [Bacteroidales bacterium]